MAPTQPVPIARWDAARDAWIQIPDSHMLPIFEPSDVWSETFPLSGICVHGTVSPLPQSEPPTDGSASSSSPGGLLPTPAARDWKDAGASPATLNRHSPPIVAPLLLKTPTAQLAVNGGSQHPDKRKAGGHGPTLADEIEHLLED